MSVHVYVCVYVVYEYMSATLFDVMCVHLCLFVCVMHLVADSLRGKS